MKWRMDSQCDNCPFAESGQGLFLRQTLRPGRWRGILDGLRAGEHFFCHKTVEWDGDDETEPEGKKLVCAGAIEWQDKHGCSSQYVRICERISPDNGQPKS